MPEQKTILLASANVFTDKEYLEMLRLEREAIQDALTPSIQRLEVFIEREPECSFKTLFDKFNQSGSSYKGKIKLLHYSGHSSADGLVLHHSGEGNQTIAPAHFAEFLRLQNGLDVVFLNSCCSDFIGELLLENGVKAVIETTTSIKDSEAAEFATCLYQELNNGKNLENAFRGAELQFETKYPGCIRKEGNQRSISGFHIIEDEKKFAWKLSYKNKKDIENWYLVKRIYPLFFGSKITKRILVIYDVETIGNEKYADMLKSLFLDKSELFIYSLAELLKEPDPRSLLDKTDISLVLSTQRFTLFWDSVDTSIKEIIGNSFVIQIAINGSISVANQAITKSLNLTTIPILPSFGGVLENISPDRIDDFAHKNLKEEIMNFIYPIEERVLTSHLDNLNFGKQRTPFESEKYEDNPFEFGRYNLVLIEGSPDCAQELLVKKLLEYATPLVEKNLVRYNISIEKNIPKFLSKEELYLHIGNSLQIGKVINEIEALSKGIEHKIQQQDLVIVLNDVVEKHGDCLYIFQEFWKDLTIRLTESPSNRLFLFILHKDCKECKNHWKMNDFYTNPPLVNVRLLDAIETLSYSAFNSWHVQTRKNFPDEHYFYSLIKKTEVDEILENPYMKKAIAKICHKMKCPSVLSRVLTI